jgi:hypothetical protein
MSKWQHVSCHIINVMYLTLITFLSVGVPIDMSMRSTHGHAHIIQLKPIFSKYRVAAVHSPRCMPYIYSFILLLCLVGAPP